MAFHFSRAVRTALYLMAGGWSLCHLLRMVFICTFILDPRMYRRRCLCCLRTVNGRLFTDHVLLLHLVLCHRKRRALHLRLCRGVALLLAKNRMCLRCLLRSFAHGV